MSLAITNAVNTINLNKSPVLFVDTCSILDVFRTIFRDGVPVDIISSAIDITERFNATSVWLVVSETIITELQENKLTVLNELKKAIKAVDERNILFLAAINMITPPPTKTIHKFDSYNIDTHLNNIVDNFISKCLVLNLEEHHSAKAMNRVIKGVSPSNKGKQQAKDCLIFEIFLDFSKRLRDSGFNNHIVFISSNSNDYGKPNNADNPLKDEFLNINAKYVNTLSWAVSVLDGRA